MSSGGEPDPAAGPLDTAARRAGRAAGGPVLRIVDARAGGDITRVIIGGAPALRGTDVAAQCADFARRHDHLRLKLMQPPHGTLQMSVVLLLPARTGDADLGVIIMESMGYPPISGTNLFCAAAVALERGFAEMREPETQLRVAGTAGVVPIRARCRDGRCRRVEFENAPARVRSSLRAALAPGAAPAVLTRVSAGVEYTVIHAREVGVALVPESHDALLMLGARAASIAATDYVLFHGDFELDAQGWHCTVAVFQNPAVICRSATGTGTSAMLAVAHARGLMAAGGTLRAESAFGGRFLGRILAADGSPHGASIRTAISGDVQVGAERLIR